MFVRVYGTLDEPILQTFERFCELIGPWPGMFVEPDGSFVWAMHTDAGRLQLDGMIYDQAGHIEYLELKGHCTRELWTALCSFLVPPRSLPATQLPLHELPLRIHDIQQESWMTAGEALQSLVALEGNT
ncbi:MAG: hypothetical protein WCI02_07950 [Planctomycetota bacterium]|jgi:hypothetical protein